MNNFFEDFIIKGNDIYTDTIMFLEFLRDEIQHYSYLIDSYDEMSEVEQLACINNNLFKCESLKLIIDRYIKYIDGVRNNGNK